MTILEMKSIEREIKSQTSESELKQKGLLKLFSKYPILRWTLLIFPLLLLLPLLIIDIQVLKFTNRNCQARVRSPKVKTKRTLADTIITWATTPLPHPQLLSMKECSGKKVLKVKVAQNDPLDSWSQKN